MKVRKTLKLDKVAFNFDEFISTDDDHYDCVVLKNGKNITLYADNERDNGLYCYSVPYTEKITKGELRKAIKWSERRSPQPDNRTRKSVFVHPFTGKCKLCHQSLDFKFENFDWGWCHPECEADRFEKFVEEYEKREDLKEVKNV